MSTESNEIPAQKFNIVGLNFVSLYFKEYDKAVEFYTGIFGKSEFYKEEGEKLYGIKMGSTWLTIFPSEIGTEKNNNPCNTEFAVQVSTPEEVDVLYQTLLEAGCKNCMIPQDTVMYDKMRFCCVDDPFGVRIDVYCPL